MGKNLKRQVFQTLEITGEASGLARAVQVGLMALILLNVLAVILTSVDRIEQQFGVLLYGFEVLSVAVFTIEYVLRVWSCTEDDRWRRPLAGRLRYMLTWMALIDLLAILPFYLPMLIPIDLRSLRAIRLLRLFRLLKMGRHSRALQILGRVVSSRKEELWVSVCAVLVLLVVSSSLVYYAERDAQPDTFSSIPQSMWWSVVTLTTVGYGDVFPVTSAGKVVAGIIALLGVALFAMPTAILASAFIEELQSRKGKVIQCPHCGKTIE